MKSSSKLFAVLIISSLTSCATISPIAPRFENSVVSHNIDLIESNDPTILATIDFVKTNRCEMPDIRQDDLFDENTYVFNLIFEDQTAVEIWAHSDFSSKQEAKEYVELVVSPLGKLPKSMRATLDHVVLHKGNQTAFAEHLGHFFVLYSENISKRQLDNDLEETIFHESVHATLDHEFANDLGWLRAQKKDNAYVTEYGKKYPSKEDLAETALFAFSLSINNDRLPADLLDWLESSIPYRLKYLSSLFNAM